MFKVLIVDDELYIREGLKVLLQWEKFGFEICGQAENGEQAYSMLKELKPDLIITDIKMPLMNGLELIEKVNKDLERDMKFVVLSGYNEFEYARKAMRYNVKNYVLKPIEEEELEAVIKEVYGELYEERNNKEVNLKGVGAVLELSLKTILKSVGDRESVNNVKKLLKLGDDGDFRYIKLEVENCYQVKNEKIEEDNANRIKAYIVEILGEVHKLNVFQEDYIGSKTLSYGIIVTEELLRSYENDINIFVKSIYTQLADKINRKIYMYVGKNVDKLLSLRESYDTAIFAHSIRFYKNKFEVIYYDDVKDAQVGSKFNFDDLVEAIENNNSSQIIETIKNNFGEENDKLPDLKMLSISINFLVYQIIRVVSKMNGETTEILKYSSNFNFNDFITLDEIKDSIKIFSYDCAKFISNLRQRQSHGILSEVEKYIQDNYEKSISIKEAAAYFYINSAYLGQIFKRKYGISFGEYLHQYRIKKAKELLISTDFKIYEISEKLGYKNCDNFIAKFEKIIGTTPNQYRKSI